ncbi:hypothetical protein SAY87_005645 [Trapa incisa]|uniref:Pre-mRNA-splicing factor SLU7 n=1 Tax=Trapa incisa TaxID=236973 RepID=A0AAN7K6T5_9MYRT|nr:hypothetical protein SAY87_005645 [Trapa incisa]
MDFAKVEKRVRTTGGGSTGTVRNLREDTAKYLLNLDVNSAYYDPKTRSMREDPLPDARNYGPSTMIPKQLYDCLCKYLPHTCFWEEPSPSGQKDIRNYGVY